jgi:endonuclease/exonuclease/phosphatase family metal-dependent hydrolase
VRKDVIDHVFVSKHFKANRWAVLTDTYYGKYPSDHFPVAVELEF